MLKPEVRAIDEAVVIWEDSFPLGSSGYHPRRTKLTLLLSNRVATTALRLTCTFFVESLVSELMLP